MSSTDPALQGGPLKRLCGISFSKMNGAGNSIVVLDLRGSTIEHIEPAEAITLHRSQAFDQLMVLHDSRTPGTLSYVKILNNDGSEAGACGNGTRCVAWALMRHSGGFTADTARDSGAASLPSQDTIVVETVRGLLECRRVSAFSFTVDMGSPQLAASEVPLRDDVADTSSFELDYPCAALRRPAGAGMGNPHAVFFLEGSAEEPGPDGSSCTPEPDIAVHGPALETHPMFPAKANISFARVVSRDRIALRVWERGVGITQACGSAACATLVSAVRRGLADRTATVSLPGGELQIEWRESDGHVLMTGPVELEHEGVLTADMLGCGAVSGSGGEGSAAAP